ncbi:hypothetical protein EGW08_019120 [Elysia chlorotica]|uniref:EGF-like domain-containing protein n=1 Tax=Elysia chlorotica TaxID=188477 RepID=A0A3S1AV88_ELYCH|nr:hypothetical protein EGW08_019120 [Elysia chlorotica]
MASFRARVILLGFAMLSLIGIQIYRIHFDSGPIVLTQDQITEISPESVHPAKSEDFQAPDSKRFHHWNEKRSVQRKERHAPEENTASPSSSDSLSSREDHSEKTDNSDKRNSASVNRSPHKAKQVQNTARQKKQQPNGKQSSKQTHGHLDKASGHSSDNKKPHRISSPSGSNSSHIRGVPKSTRGITKSSRWFHLGELGTDFEYYNMSWRRVSLITDNITIDISKYMNGPPVYRAPVLAHNPKLCDVDGELYLLVIVPSLPRHHVIRAVIRDTWASPAYNGGLWAGRPLTDKVRLVFSFGGTNYTDDDKALLRLELKEYQDILVMDFIDSYQNLSIKMANTLFWAGHFCKDARHVLKADEDTYVHLPQLISLVKRVEKITDSFVLGHQHTHENPQVVRKGRWRVGLEYLLPFYPRYIVGHSYVISGHAVPSILTTLKQIPGVAKLNNIPRLHSRAFAGTFYKQVLCNVTRGYYVSLTFCCKEHLLTLYKHAVEGMCDSARFDHIPTRRCRFFRHMHPLQFIKKTNMTEMKKVPQRVPGPDDMKQLESLLNLGAGLIGGMGKRNVKDDKDEEYEDIRERMFWVPANDNDGELRKPRPVETAILASVCTFASAMKVLEVPRTMGDRDVYTKFWEKMIFLLALGTVTPAMSEAADTVSFSISTSDCLNDQIKYRPMMLRKEDSSQVRCVIICRRVPNSKVAIHLEEKISSKTCICLGAMQPEPVSELQTDGSDCTFYSWLEELPSSGDSAEECENKGKMVNGVCECPEGVAGERCEFIVPQHCSAQYDHIYDGLVYRSFDKLEAVKDFVRHVKVIFVYNDTVFVAQVTSQELKKTHDSYTGLDETIWAGQVPFVMKKTAQGAYPDKPKLEAFSVLTTLKLHNVEINLEGSHYRYVGTVMEDIIIKALPSSVGTIAYGVGQTSTKVLESLILEGAEILTGSAVVLGQDDILLHSTKRLRTASDFRPLFSPSFEIPMHSTQSSAYLKHDYTILNSFSTTTSPDAGDWLVDTCWYRATTDHKDVYDELSADHLRRAVSQGRRARVVVDGFSAVTRAVYLLDHYVLFQSAPYLHPRDIISYNEGIGHQLTSTHKTTIQCIHKPTSYEVKIAPLRDHVDNLEWFVDARSATELYITDLKGRYISGHIETLFREASIGMDIQLVIEFLNLDTEDSITLSVTVDNIYFPSEDVLVAEIRNILFISTSAIYYDLMETDHCAMVNLLAHSKTGLSGMVYALGDSYYNVEWRFGVPTDGGRIRWFVRGFQWESD